MFTNSGLLVVLIYALGIVIVLYSIILHEIAHGYTAYLLGDDTAKLTGRLSLNPLKHIDIYGTVILPIILILLRLPVFGWAKPVPVNPSRMENPNADYFLTALAGPITNLLIAVIFGLAIRFAHLPFAFETLFFFVVEINLVLMVLNILPIPPLDGSKILALFLPHETYLILEQFGIYILIALIVFSSALPIIPYIITHAVGFFFHLITGSAYI